MPALDARDQLQTLKRGLEVLRFLNLQNWATISDVAKRFDLPRTTSQRILRTLLEEGYVARDRTTKKYALTPVVCALSAGFDEEDWVVDVANPILRALTKEITWPVLLAVPFGERMLVRAATDHDTPLAIDRFHIGATIPMAVAPTGQVFLAFCDATTRNHIVALLARSDDPLQKSARATDAFKRQLAGIRRQGYVIFSFEHNPEMRESGVAVPVMVNDRVFGSILMRFVKRALSVGEVEDVYVPRLQRAARDIASKLDQLRLDNPKAFTLYNTLSAATGSLMAARD